MSEGTIIRSVVGCARCGAEHKSLVFTQFVNPPVSGHATDNVELTLEATHWATCPATGDPILMTIVPEGVSAPDQQ